MLVEKIDQTQCLGNKCQKMDLCRMQWGSRNLSRAIFGDNSFFGLNQINFSLPIAFEYTDNPEFYLTMTETKELLSVNYLGKQNDQPNSIMNYTNINYILNNINRVDLIATRLVLSEQKTYVLISWIYHVMKSVKIIQETNFEIAYFRGKSLLQSKVCKRRFDQFAPIPKGVHSDKRDNPSFKPVDL